MLNLGAGEILLILVVALLVLGPKRLPELARGLGKFFREFRRQTDEVRTVVEREFYRMDQQIQDERAPVGTIASGAPSPAPALPNPADHDPALHDHDPASPNPPNPVLPKPPGHGPAGPEGT